ncbi:MAG: DUF2459 domain-containing protein [Bernardetiaceae bacterium]|nr:DUF2459 domain-containing protein [Bernardetiaceae bacterium]
MRKVLKNTLFAFSLAILAYLLLALVGTLVPPAASRRAAYLSLGWGDEGFYLNSFGGQFPGVGTTLAAVFWPTPSLMHVGFWAAPPAPGPQVARLLVTPAQLGRLLAYAGASFARQPNGSFQFKQTGYGPHDYFFTAQGHYHLFFTCNNWTNQALAQAGLPASWWSPFAQGVMWRVQAPEPNPKVE